METIQKERRPCSVNVSFSTVEYEKIVCVANKNGSNLAQAIRHLLFYREGAPLSDVPPPPEEKMEESAPAAAQNKPVKKPLNFYCMQKLTICGFISADAESFKANNGVEMMNFIVDCTDSKSVVTRYDVYIRKSPLFDSLKSGRQVIVVGDLKIRGPKDRPGKENVAASLYGDNVVLGKDSE